MGIPIGNSVALEMNDPQRKVHSNEGIQLFDKGRKPPFKIVTLLIYIFKHYHNYIDYKVAV
jgi:hypothetical protein